MSGWTESEVITIYFRARGPNLGWEDEDEGFDHLIEESNCRPPDKILLVASICGNLPLAKTRV